jgi:hypothetical protein
MFFLSETQHRQGLKGLEDNRHRLSPYAFNCSQYKDNDDDDFTTQQSNLSNFSPCLQKSLNNPNKLNKLAS